MPSRSAHGLRPALLLAAGLLACQPADDSLSVEEAMEAVSYATFQEHMAALSSDAMAGRRPGTAGYDSAAAYVVREAAALGLEPGGIDGSYLQPIRFRRATVAPGAAAFVAGGQSLAFGSDFSLSPRIYAPESDIQAPLVFAGFGISAPELGYDDFEGVEVEGKLVVVVSGAPDGFGSLERTVLSSSKARDAELLARGAAGVVVIQPEGRPVGSTSRPRTGYLVPGGDEELGAALVVSRRVASEWMSRAGRRLDEVLAAIRGGEPRSFDLGLDARVTARFEYEAYESANVAALLPGTDPDLQSEHLVMTAHLDHLGTGEPLDGDSIYNGTLDNASGSSALLTLASVLTRMEAPRRSLLFLWVTAEESGLLGAEYFARFPTVDGTVVANQNIDGVMGMIATATDMLAFGYEHSNLSAAVDYAVARTGTPISPDPT
ncbi:MAG: M28 family peptidase, partial [Longimicrobiales bacterium]|nr:M28 family peptidase [Longimicrobiales bacterium]